MLILAVNCGSSSLKAQIIDATAQGERPLARAVVERIGSAEVPDHDAAIARALAEFRGRDLAAPDAIGHRIVHGGSRFTAPTLIDDGVIAELTALEDLAPLHNAPGVAGIRACRRHAGGATPMVAVFDTGFHATLPEVAYRYAIPMDLAERHGIRRYGFHGISYAYVVSRYAELVRRAPESIDMIALHLGNGASITAIRGGRSIDTSMGLTPLEGLVMGTRSGDLDPAIVEVLARREGVGAAEVERWLNERSGLLGLWARCGGERGRAGRHADRGIRRRGRCVGRRHRRGAHDRAPDADAAGGRAWLTRASTAGARASAPSVTGGRRRTAFARSWRRSAATTRGTS